MCFGLDVGTTLVFKTAVVWMFSGRWSSKLPWLGCGGNVGLQELLWLGCCQAFGLQDLLCAVAGMFFVCDRVRLEP